MSTGQQPNDKKTSEVYFVIKLATNGYYRWMNLNFKNCIELYTVPAQWRIQGAGVPGDGPPFFERSVHLDGDM